MTVGERYGAVTKFLHWAVFLLLIMAAILLIDLQLKKSIARQAVTVATWLNEVRYGGEPVPGPAGPDPVF